MPRSIKDSVVVITGASSGIGAELARQLHARGARLVLAARRLEKLEELTLELGKAHLCLKCDVSISSDCERLISVAVESLGRIDTLVCNAGYGVGKLSAQTTRDETRKMFETNMLGTTHCASLAAQVMKRQPKLDGYRGQIMIVSSAAARRGLPMLGVYSATKAAQLVYAESLRVESLIDDIAVTTVHPVGTKTEFADIAQQQGEPFDVPGRSLFQQTATQVAVRMVGAIRVPVRECWPFWPARFVVALNAFCPWLGDFAMDRQLQGIRKKR